MGEVNPDGDEVLGMLNQATQAWKETGEVGMKLKEPSVSWRTKVKELINKLPSVMHDSPAKAALDADSIVDKDREEIDNLLEQLTKTYKPNENI